MTSLLIKTNSKSQFLLNLATGKKNYFFRGCGWPKKAVSWCREDKLWILAMNHLFESLYGKDMLKYIYIQGQGAKVQDSDNPMTVFQYDHKVWEENYKGCIEAIQTDFPKSVKSLKPQLEMCPLQSEKMSAPPVNSVTISNLQGTPSAVNSQNSSLSSRGNDLKEAPSSSSGGTVSMPGSVMSTTASSVAHVDLTFTTQPQMTSHHLDAWLATLGGLSRRNLSNITVPPPAAVPLQGSDIVVLFGAYHESDPLSVKERPAERLVIEAEKAFRSALHSPEQPTGVVIGNLGAFSRDGLAVLRKYCEISALRLSVRSEERWLTEYHDGLSADEISCIQDGLWNHRTSEPILRADRKSLDVASFSTLVEERYVDNFVIDVTMWYYHQDCQKQVNSSTLYLPSEIHTWLKTNDHQFLHRKLEEVMTNTGKEELQLILCPLHMNGSHWGLVVIDLLNGKLLFDDGYKLQPDSSVLVNMKSLLDIFQQLRPGALCFGNTFWSSIDQFERFGMPSQHECGRTGQGTGSCGVGVILAARDFLYKGVTGAVYQFGWKYTQMRLLRKQLMLQILKWGSS